MTENEVIVMLSEAIDQDREYKSWHVSTKHLMIFAAMVQKIEREAPQRTWVGLTDDEYFALQMKIKAPMISVQDYIDAMRMVEAKLKEKNT